jgi:cell division protein FtsW (lipid II flippase)
MKTNQKSFNYDISILIVYCALMLIGLYMQLNIGSVRSSMHYFYMQVAWSVLAFFSLTLAFRYINLEKARKFIFPLLILVIGLLIMTLVMGVEHKGGIRRIFGMQPSSFARILIILYFAHILDKKKHVLDDTEPKAFFKHFHTLILMSCLVFGLVLLGRHLSILIILGCTLLGMLWLANIKIKTIGLIIGICLLLFMGVLLFGRDYRKERVSVYGKYSLFFKMLGIEKEYRGDKDYQIKESLISLASGSFFGTTPLRGTGKHYFLPEARTDYIFSIIGEDLGFLIAVFTFGLYVFLFWRVILNARKTDSLFIKLVSYGLGMNIFYNAIVNIGVAMSALPSTGVTLPFISYGGTSLLVNSFSVGLLLNISMVRKNTEGKR